MGELNPFVRFLMIVCLVGGSVAMPAGAASATTAFPCTGRWERLHVPLPGPEGQWLSDVIALGPSDIWIAGSQFSRGLERRLAMHWDGTGWTVVPTPNSPHDDNAFSALFPVSSDDIWGLEGDVGAGGKIFHWDGARWTRVPLGAYEFTHVVTQLGVVAPDDIWGVGVRYPQSGPYALGPVPYLVHWDGTSWSPARQPVQGFGSLNGIEVQSADDIWAVGESNGRTLIEHWDGTAWSVTPTHGPEGSDVILNDVDGPSPTDLWAVGGTGQGYGRTIVMHWDGTTWSNAETPHGWRIGELTQVRFDGAVGWALGTRQVERPNESFPVSELQRYVDGEWRGQRGLVGTDFSAVASTSGLAIAVGSLRDEFLDHGVVAVRCRPGAPS